MPLKTSDQIHAAIDNFVEELELLVRRNALETIQRTLGKAASTGGMPARGARLAPTQSASQAGATQRVKRAKRTGSEVEALAEKLHKYIAKHPGQRMEQISTGMKRTSKELTLPLQKLKSEKRLKTKGQKLATEYYAK